MLVEGKTLGQTSCQIRGCKTAGIEPRQMHPEEVATLKMICEGLIHETGKRERDDVHDNLIAPTKRLKVCPRIIDHEESELHIPVPEPSMMVQSVEGIFDFNYNNISDTSDEMEQDDALPAKIKIHKEQI